MAENILVNLILLAGERWPLFLMVAAALALPAFLLPGAGAGPSLLRLGFALSSLAVLAPPVLLLAFATAERLALQRQRAEDARITTALAAPAEVDGVALPAGAVVRWRDPSRQEVASVDLPRPNTAGGRSTAAAMGLSGVYWIHRQGRDRWTVGVEDDQEVGGFPCAAPHIDVNTRGELRGCRLARDAAWGGWVLPAGADIVVDPERGPALSATLPEARPLVAPHGVGALPTLRVEFHADGSLASARYAREAPLAAPGGRRLWGDVRFRYADPPGAGRARAPVAATGADADDPSSDARDGPFATLPWPAPR